MQKKSIKRFILNNFWLSILFHILILLYLFSILAKPPVKEKNTLLPHYYVPAYTYSGSIKPTMQKQTAKHHVKEMQAKQASIKKINSADVVQPVDHRQRAIQVPKESKKQPREETKTKITSASLLADSFNMLKEEQIREVSQPEEPDPIYLIGDDSQPADPLIRLIGRSLSTHFKYPRVAGELGIKGLVLLEFTFHPEGYYSNLKMVKSSNNQDLDAAALYAVNAAPKVYGADRFISKPKRMVVGFIFQ
jgi:TonB family protein